MASSKSESQFLPDLQGDGACLASKPIDHNEYKQLNPLISRIVGSLPYSIQNVNTTEENFVLSYESIEEVPADKLAVYENFLGEFFRESSGGEWITLTAEHHGFNGRGVALHDGSIIIPIEILRLSLEQAKQGQSAQIWASMLPVTSPSSDPH